MQMDGYSTHQALLVAAMGKTSGMILEIGGGWYSTPLVNALATTQKRRAITVETSDYVYQHLKFLNNEYHLVQIMPGFDFDDKGHLIRDGKSRQHYDELHQRFLNDLCSSHGVSPDSRVSVAFVDHKPGSLRHKAVDFLADKADYVIVHDAEHVDHYHYEPTFSSFRYRFNFVLHVPNTVLLSNYLPCDEFKFLQPADRPKWKADLKTWMRQAKALSLERQAKAQALEMEQHRLASQQARHAND